MKHCQALKEPSDTVTILPCRQVSVAQAPFVELDILTANKVLHNIRAKLQLPTINIAYLND